MYSFGTHSFGGDNERTVEWVLTGAGEIRIGVRSEKAGTDERTVLLPGR